MTCAFISIQKILKSKKEGRILWFSGNNWSKFSEMFKKQWVIPCDSTIWEVCVCTHTHTHMHACVVPRSKERNAKWKQQRLAIYEKPCMLLKENWSSFMKLKVREIVKQGTQWDLCLTNICICCLCEGEQ